MEKGGEATNLLKDIRRASLQIKTNTSVYDALGEAKVMYYSYRQGEEESNAKHLHNFKIIIDALINYEKREDATKCEQRKSNEDCMQVARGKMMGVALIKFVNKKYKTVVNKHPRPKLAQL